MLTATQAAKAAADAQTGGETAPRLTGFTRIAHGGLGDPYNSYAHSMAWFDGALHVGTTRANLHLRQTNDPPGLQPWPVKPVEDVYKLDLRAQIWRYEPGPGEWTRIHRAANLPGRDDRVPQDLGYRGMAVVDEESRATPGLYVSTWSPSRGTPPGFLFSAGDGHFRRLPGAEAITGRVASHRALVSFNGWLFTAPVGRPHGRPNETDGAVVLVSEDPLTRGWQAACETGFGDPSNSSVMEMCVFGEHLYAGTLNWQHGFQLWRTAAAGRPPFRWVKMLDGGAGRGQLNQVALSLMVFRGALYIGTGVQGGGYDRAHRIGPGAAELIRLGADGHWDLVVGETRRTNRGVRMPTSGLGPGFGNPFAGYLWRMCAHEGRLYAGTYDWSVFAPFLPLEKFPPAFARMVRDASLGYDVVSRRGGFDLWRSDDGDAWHSITANGFENPYNFGARSIESTPAGLFLGTANPFGPEVAARTPTGWTYCPHDGGGFEVWRLPPTAHRTRRGGTR